MCGDNCKCGDTKAAFSEKSGGTLTVEVYPASQLGNAISQIEAVSLGSQDMFHGSGTWVATYVEDRGVAGMFFVFQNAKHFNNYVESDLMKDVENQFLNKLGVRIISNNWRVVPRCMASKKEIRTVDDMKGVKFRVPDIKAYLDSVTALGSSPTQVAYGETYLALMQGVVDACEGPFDNLYTMKFYEAAKNVIMTEHIHDNYVVMINERRFNSLSPNQQKALVEASNEAGVFFNAEVTALIDTYTKLMKDNGGNFIEVDKAPFTEAVGAKIKELEANGAWKKGLFDAIQALK
jgi:tripartite ATP-independent transporter DctP family solute receptor